MRTSVRLGAAATVAALGATLLTAYAPGATAASGSVERFVVLYRSDANLAQARKAVRDAGGRILRENRAVGAAVVETRNTAFRTTVDRSSQVSGVARDRYIGYTPPAAPSPAASRTAARTAVRAGSASRESGRALEKQRDVGASTEVRRTAAATGTVGTEPFSERQWDMQLLHAVEAQRDQPGDRRVLVGVIDTGVDGNHPDLAANFNKSLSRNFVRDIPTDPAGRDLDGPCEVASCVDPVDVDDDGHGTHVASTIASPVNGIGVSGVAPDVQVVNVRAGQDSGYFFLMPTLDALTYSGDAGLDVVNMSFYTDPWLFNCAANPADSPAEQEEQRVVVEATQRAADYAHARGVTLIAAAGNENTDLSKPSTDETSPDYPQTTDEQDFTHPRKIDPKACVSVPTQTRHVISVSSVGPSTRKSYYSNYGTGQIDVAAPGGDTRDVLGRPQGAVLAAAPRNVLLADDELDANGDPKGAAVGFVLRDPNRKDAYFQYLQGTSMAAPHAVGVAALIISQYGSATSTGFGLAPDLVQALLQGTATETDCPSPAKVVYNGNGGYTSTCEGGRKYNGFYGHGIVDAQAAVNAG